jgi:lauroyl/myristoyl acyltransferase
MSADSKRPRFRSEERHEVRYHLSVLFAEMFSWLFWIVPDPIRYWLADRVGDIFRRSTHTYRDNVESNLSQVLGDVDPAILNGHVTSIFRTSARNFTDLITLPRRSREALKRDLTCTRGSWQLIDDALAGGKGVILVSAHLGCFDMVGAGIWARGYNLTIVTGRTTSRFIFDGVTHLRGSRGSTMVEPTPAGVRKVMRALKQNECAVLVADRDFFQNGRPVTFFGKETSLPPGPIRIARETGATVIPILPRRRGNLHEIDILEPFIVPKTDDFEADMNEGFRLLLPALEYGIQSRPGQWVMFQRVWPEVPAPPVRVFPVGSPLESELLEKVAKALPERPAGSKPATQWKPEG